MKKLHPLNWPFAFARQIAATASLGLLLIAGNLSAAISVGPSGASAVVTFDALPTVASGWATATNAGGAGDAAAGDVLDALVITNEVSNFTIPLVAAAQCLFLPRSSLDGIPQGFI